jgi:hypothetical protein
MARWTPGKKGKKATDIGGLVATIIVGGAEFADVQRKRVETPPRQMLVKVQDYLDANGYADTLEAYIDSEPNGYLVRIAPLAVAE